jgi:hypothetical protein
MKGENNNPPFPFPQDAHENKGRVSAAQKLKEGAPRTHGTTMNYNDGSQTILYNSW